MAVQELLQDEAWFTEVDSALDTELLIDCPTLFLPEPAPAHFGSAVEKSASGRPVSGKRPKSGTPSPNVDLNSDLLLQRPPSRQRDLPIHLNSGIDPSPELTQDGPSERT